MTLAKAQLFEISWSKQGDPIVPENAHMTVQFNPASLKVSYSNQVQTDGNNNNSAMQYVGKGDSKLAVELVFDISAIGGKEHRDVRQMTQKIAHFMQTTPEKANQTADSTDSTPASPSSTGSSGSQPQEQQRFKVPGLRFQWGTFLFDGILISMDETLELWSEDGRPLRATVSLNLSQPGIHFKFNQNTDATPSPKGALQAGITPLTPSPQGATFQGMVSSTGSKTDWKVIAAANGIENPRQITPGTLINIRKR